LPFSAVQTKEEIAMSSRLLTCLFAASALFTVACDDSSGLPSGQAANVRVVNASSVAGDLDVLVNGTAQASASDIAFLNSSAQCVRVDADNPGLTFQQTAGTAVLPAPSFTFDNGGRNTVVVAGSGTGLRYITLSDALTPELQPGRARVRVVNARAATNMGVTVTPWNQTAGTPQIINTTDAQATGWVDVPAGQMVAVRMTTTTGTAIDVLNIAPTEGQELIVVATDPATGTAPLRWTVTSACSRP
jgi:hypothetical protein